MRLHRLTLTGVGPFKARQEVDFDELSASGLFLIEGPTGSGKTTIIDAIVYALFGVVSAGSDDLTRMRIRSSYCAEADPTGVACEFSVDGRRHRIARVPAGCRDPEDPARKASSKGPRQVLVELDDAGQPVGTPLAVRREIDARIEQLLGMSAEQFRQLVVLPQGQFAELLRKTPAERLTSLAPLLEDAFIARVQEDLRSQGEAASARRDAAARDLDRAAQRLAGRLRSAIDEDEAVDFSDASLPDQARRDAVDHHLRLLDERAVQASAERRQQDLHTDRLRDAAATSAAVRDALRTVEAERSRIADARASLHDEDASIDEHAVAGRISDLRRLEGSLEADAAWEAQAAERDARLTTLVVARDKDAARAVALRQDLADLPQHRGEVQDRHDRATALSALLDARIDAEAENARLLESARQVSAREADVRAREADLAAAAAAEQRAADVAEAAQRAWEALVADHRLASASELAATLVDGAPCPVCGSCAHPHPADTAAAEVARAGLDRAATDATRAREAVATAKTSAAAAQKRHAEAVTALALVENTIGARTAVDLESSADHLRRETEEARAAAESLPGLRTELAGLADREAELHAAIGEAERAAAAAEATLTALMQAEKQQRDSIASRVGEHGTATALLAHTRARIASLTALGEAAAGLTEALALVPAEHRTMSAAEAEERAQADASLLAESITALGAITDRSAALAAAVEETAPLARAFISALDAHARILEETTAALELATLVTAGNSRRLQLRAYALQRRFESVLAAASQQLERMSTGKFTFVSTDEAARGQAGLGIQLLDAWTGHLQDPRSLSGGETFYASLALALGLAEVVRSEVGGAQLETLFVDEGFGSLDQDTLYQVLEQLDRLRAGNRAVGVVSHVTEMKESIPDRLEVRRLADSTSTIARVS